MISWRPRSGCHGVESIHDRASPCGSLVVDNTREAVCARQFTANTSVAAKACPTDHGRWFRVKTQFTREVPNALRQQVHQKSCYTADGEQESQNTTDRCTRHSGISSQLTKFPDPTLFHVLYLTTIHLAQRSSPKGSLVHALRCRTMKNITDRLQLYTLFNPDICGPVKTLKFSSARITPHKECM